MSDPHFAGLGDGVVWILQSEDLEELGSEDPLSIDVVKVVEETLVK